MEWSNDGESQGENQLTPNKIELEYKTVTSKLFIL
jgi:hypothetical protein